MMECDACKAKKIRSEHPEAKYRPVALEHTCGRTQEGFDENVLALATVEAERELRRRADKMITDMLVESTMELSKETPDVRKCPECGDLHNWVVEDREGNILSLLDECRKCLLGFGPKGKNK